MTTVIAQEGAGDSLLTIGDLARRTGLNAATLRMWESRHGFPNPRRLESGHRRYADSDVDAVARVVRLRDAGMRLELAIAEVLASSVPAAPSVFAELRRRHPTLIPYRLRKSTLLALSWAIEDEFCSRAEQAFLFGGFQHEQYYRPARARWDELARVARSAMAFAQFESPADPTERSIRVPLDEHSPMRREWAVVCDATDLPAALAAWELPGQSTVPDRHRMFEAVWTVEPRAVRDAARVCARVAQQLGVDEATPLLYALSDDPLPRTTDPAAATTLFNRVVAYVDRLGH